MKAFLPQLIIRYSLVILFAWFGVQQLLYPEAWVGYLPPFMGYFTVPGEMFVRLNGWFEVISAIALLLGVGTRLVAALLGLHLLGIAATALGAIGMRDMALGLCTLSLAFGKPDGWTIDACHAKKKLGTI